MESLGPKPTAKQMETLRKLCGEDVQIHWWAGIGSSGPDSASIVFSGDFSKRETLPTNTLHKFWTWGWVAPIGDPAWAWRNMEYRITERGRKVVELGVVRK